MRLTEQEIQELLPDFSVLGPAFREVEKRPIRYRRLEVVDYTPTNPKSEAQLAAPGTITVFLSRRGNPILGEIREAISGKDGSDEHLAVRIAELFKERTPIPLAEAVKVLQEQPVFGEIRYGTAVLASNLFVPNDLDVGVVVFPYNGGRLISKGFTFVEHYLEKEDVSIDVLVMRYAPPLSRAEAAALRQVPANQRELNVGSLGVAANTVEIVLMVILYMLLMRPSDLVEQHISENVIKEIGPAATARELLQVRRNMLMS
jgi:hypothetical protein